MITQGNTENFAKEKMKYKVTLTHTEVLYVEATDENDALQQAYEEAEYDCFWGDCEVESLKECQ